MKLGLKGFVKNTKYGTVIGQLEGEEEKVKLMKKWLSKIGSPASKIDKCIFKNEKTVDTCQYSCFDIHK
ncbi:hypothetical protein O3M35_005612 [Rhynocoris fuscipes]|uniref:acylphosphatase n=1 Tax=Rhynocoris fuscipes TaxID=488301 RepID=A0AAW1DJR1_9HEMI